MAQRRSIRYETDLWPFIQARHFGVKRTNPVRLVVIHTPIWKEVITGAEDLGRYFASMADRRIASSHIGVDSDTIVQYVKDSYVAYGAPGANHDGMHIEIIGTHTQTPLQWRDLYSITALALAADATAQYCLKYGLPAKLLTLAEVKDGRTKGVCSHHQVSQAFGRTNHTDPGPNFPWKRFIRYTEGALEDRR